MCVCVCVCVYVCVCVCLCVCVCATAAMADGAVYTWGNGAFGQLVSTCVKYVRVCVYGWERERGGRGACVHLICTRVCVCVFIRVCANVSVYICLCACVEGMQHTGLCPCAASF